ncbi:MAG: hypothetical protein J6P16_00385 [Eubacterium sp.]|nr:hypothetical protein [Eubacterium sp.]
MPRGMRKQKRLKKRLLNQKPQVRYEWLLKLKDATGCILLPEEKYRIYLRLEDEFGELADLDEDEAQGFSEFDICEELSEECGRIARELKKDLPDEIAEYSRTEMMSAYRRQEADREASGGNGIARWIILGIAVLAVAFLVCYKIPATRAVIGDIGKVLGFNSFAIKSYRVAGDISDGWSKAAELERQIIEGADIGARVKLGRVSWIVLKHSADRTLLISEEVIKDRAFQKDAGDVSWEDSSLREYLNGKYLNRILYKSEHELISETELTSVAGSTDPSKAGSEAKTTDLVFIPNEDDVFDYEDILGTMINNLRLRDAGLNPDTTAFVSAEGDIVDEGYPADIPGCYIRPMLWVASK